MLHDRLRVQQPKEAYSANNVKTTSDNTKFNETQFYNNSNNNNDSVETITKRWNTRKLNSKQIHKCYGIE